MAVKYQHWHKEVHGLKKSKLKVCVWYIQFTKDNKVYRWVWPVGSEFLWSVWCGYMWCDLGKSVWSRTCNSFSFLFDWSAHLERYIVVKIPPEPVVPKLWAIKGFSKQKKCIPFPGYISQVTTLCEYMQVCEYIHVHMQVCIYICDVIKLNDPHITPGLIWV